MNFSTERSFKSQFLIKKFNFVDNRLKEIFIPKDIELSAKRKIKTKRLTKKILLNNGKLSFYGSLF